MRKFVIPLAVAIILAIGAGVAYYLFQSRGTPPGLGTALRADRVALLVGAEGLDTATQELSAAVEGLPAEARKALEPMWPAAPAERVKRLGFDPQTAEGWQSVGLDPVRGFALVLDAELMVHGTPKPLLVLAVADRSKLKAHLEKLAGGLTEEVIGKSTIVTFPEGGVILTGERAGFTLALILDAKAEAAGLQAPFEALLSGGPLLGDDPSFKRAFAQRQKTGLFVYGHAAGLAAIATVAAKAAGRELAKGDVDFYVNRFPAFAAFTDAKEGHGRLLASAEGLGPLRQMFMPTRNAPKFSRFVASKGQAVGRLSLNLESFFEGLGNLFPPSQAEAKNLLLMGLSFGTAQLGVSLTDLRAAFSGHFAAALPVSGDKDLTKALSQSVVMVGLGDGDKATAVVKTLLGKLGTVEERAFDGKPGFATNSPGGKVFIVRDDDVMLVAMSEEAITAALKADGATGALKDLLDENVFFGWAINKSEYTALLTAQGAKLNADALPEVISGQIVVDDEGLSAHYVGVIELTLTAFANYLMYEVSAPVILEAPPPALEMAPPALEVVPPAADAAPPAADAAP